MKNNILIKQQNIMNKNIDLKKILENCPRGTRLYTTTFGYVNFKMLIPSSEYPIIVSYKDEIDEKKFYSGW